MTSNESMQTDLIASFRSLCEAARGVDLADPEAACAELETRLHPASERARALAATLARLLEEGRIAERGAPPVRFGRVSKPREETLDFSIDVVVMSAPGPKHRHPRGEVNYCIGLEGSPTFDGRPPGWVVLPPGSEHVPTVAGGTMLIVYLLPQGEIQFLEHGGTKS